MLRTMAGLQTPPSNQLAREIMQWWRDHELPPDSANARGLIWSTSAKETSGADYLMISYRYSMSWANLAKGAAEFLDSIQNGFGPEDEQDNLH